MKNRLFFLLAGLLILTSCTEHKDLRLPKEQRLADAWAFYHPSDGQWYPAEVPGTIHLDLFRNHIIPQPFRNCNEDSLRWIEHKDWRYACEFMVDKDVLEYDQLDLVFDGLDTYAEVYVNGKKALTADNMFRQWEVSAKGLLKPGSNSIRVHFTSPLNFLEEKVRSSPFALPAGNEPGDVPLKVSPYVRKAAYHFGWDWAPRFVGCGIWKPVHLLAWEKARITRIHSYTLSIEENRAELIHKVYLEVDEPGQYAIQAEGISWEGHLAGGEQQIQISQSIHDPKLWWCNGLGEPLLYDVDFKLLFNEEIIDTEKHHFGIRTIDLISEKDSIGTSFYFKINGQDVFMQGANYIPQDVFLPRVKEQQYNTLIRDVKDAGMNMLRVWGGGIYESDLFYDLCDQNGILVWQDFMFANTVYPVDDAFRENVRAEAKNVILRIGGHPCIALWCGNNEIEVAWENWGWQDQYGYSKADSTLLWKNYKQIFHHMIPGILKQHLPFANYTSSSPQSNWGTAENFNHSSMHYWGVWHGREAFEAFRDNVGRFMAEYGFQSFPAIESLEITIDTEYLNLDSEVMKKRQKSYVGNGLILEHINQYYDKPEDFRDFVEKSQLTQAKGLGMAIRAHKDAQPHCMGTLFWQLNDCWPGPSWSVIDYYGRKKIAWDTVVTHYNQCESRGKLNP